MQNLRKVLIKGMVCQRCITMVKKGLETVGIYPENISLGEITLSASLSNEHMEYLAQSLRPYGFSVLEDKRTKIVREIKELIKEVYSGDYDFPARFRFSELAAARFSIHYENLSTAFSGTEGITLEKYIIEYRIEKIKEFLVYKEDTLADISFRLGFSSVAHLSRQFKEQTGLTPSHFKTIGLTKKTGVC